MKKEQIGEFRKIDEAFNQAIISNNVQNIEECISSDWALVDTKGGIIPRERFLHVVEQGWLKHYTMTKEILRVKVYDNIAIVTGRGKNTGWFKGEPLNAEE